MYSRGDESRASRLSYPAVIQNRRPDCPHYVHVGSQADQTRGDRSEEAVKMNAEIEMARKRRGRVIPNAPVASSPPISDVQHGG